MKKTIAFLLIIATLFSMNINAFAVTDLNNSTSTVEIEYFEDGSYIETVTTIVASNISTYASGTNTGSKRTTYVNANDEIMWTATLTGTFYFNGVGATCTKSSITYSIVDDNWRITSISSAEQGNQAIGYITAKYYFLGVPTKTIDRTMYLTCSKDGVLS